MAENQQAIWEERLREAIGEKFDVAYQPPPRVYRRFTFRRQLAPPWFVGLWPMSISVWTKPVLSIGVTWHGWRHRYRGE